MNHVHIVEDEEDIVELMKFNLNTEGFKVTESLTGETAVSDISKLHPDLILLDLMLPGMDGLQVCREMKGSRSTEKIPIIMVTAKGEEDDIIKGLELGADDYLTKPFSPKVLIARVRAVLRRSDQLIPSEDAPLELSEIKIHPGRREVFLKDQKITLTDSEFRILHLLLRRPGWVFTRSQIVHLIRGDNYAVTDRSIDVQIVGLRKKLRDFGSFIETVRGVGYRFKED